MKIISVIPVKGREPLLYYTVKRLTNQGVGVICVGHTDSERRTCRKAGASFLYYSDRLKLGAKWQFGIDEARKHKPDAILLPHRKQ